MTEREKITRRLDELVDRWNDDDESSGTLAVLTEVLAVAVERLLRSAAERAYQEGIRKGFACIERTAREGSPVPLSYDFPLVEE